VAGAAGLGFVRPLYGGLTANRLTALNDPQHHQTNGCAGLAGMAGTDRAASPVGGGAWSWQRYGGMSLIVSASQRYSVAATVSRVVMRAACADAGWSSRDSPAMG
jgi:hypothetical protein